MNSIAASIQLPADILEASPLVEMPVQSAEAPAKSQSRKKSNHHHGGGKRLPCGVCRKSEGVEHPPARRDLGNEVRSK